MSVYTRTFLALGAGSRKVMVLSAFTSGERTLVTTLASTPGPRPRPVGPLPPGGLLLIWAWTEAATSVASAVAGRTRRILFIVSDRLYFNPSKPDLRVFNLDRDLPARERDELPGILRIGLLKPRRDIHGAAVDDVRRAIALPDDLDRIPLVQQLEVAILDEAAAGRFRGRDGTSPRGRTGSGSGSLCTAGPLCTAASRRRSGSRHSAGTWGPRAAETGIPGLRPSRRRIDALAEQARVVIAL